MGNLIVKDNALITASHRLSEVEQRLVLLAILQTRNECKTVEQLKGKELFIRADEYASIFEISKDMAYKALKKAVIGLFDAKWGYKYINDKGNKVVAYERFTQSAKYIEGEGVVSFRFADAIIPFLVELERNFTAYEIEQISELSSQYAMRLYEFFMQNLDKKTGKGWLDISLDELRFRFGLLPKEYARMCDFKRDVLDLSMKQINEHTDLKAIYTQKKQGRKIVGFKFEFEYKKGAKKAKKEHLKIEQRNPNTIDIFDNLTDAEREIVANAHAYADSRGFDISHKNNIAKKQLNEFRELEKLEKDKKEQEKQEKLAKKLQEKQLLELAKNTYEKIISDENLMIEFLAKNYNEKTAPMMARVLLKQDNIKSAVSCYEYYFNDINRFKSLDLSFMNE